MGELVHEIAAQTIRQIRRLGIDTAAVIDEMAVSAIVFDGGDLFREVERGMTA
jgi:hypothetical protein